MKALILSFILVLADTHNEAAQQISIDRGIKAGNLWCFPLVSDSLTYYYLPASASLATTDKGLPGFSFLRYVTLQENTSGKSISDAGGGAVLHFLVTYNTTDEQVRKAESILQKKAAPKATIKGPVIFKKARYSLISSTLDRDQSHILRTGEAPVLENSSLAFSFELTPVDSKILLESFKTGTSDVSVIFDFTFEGLSDSYNAKLEVDWAKTHSEVSGGVTAKIYYFGTDVQIEIDNLLRKDAIRLTTSGENRTMEALVDRVYNKMVEILYEPVRPETEAKPTDDITDLIPKTIANSLKEVQKAIPFALNASYKRRSTRTEGSTVYDFNGRSTIERHHFLTFNIGDIYSRYGADPAVFRDVPLSDETFQQREVSINIDGAVERDFNNMVNNVVVTLRKIHQDSSVTVKEILINKEFFKKSASPSMSYLNQGDHDRMRWLNYEYQVTWQFPGGGRLASEWTKANSPVVNVYLPYKRWKMDFSGDMKKLEEMGIVAISVQASYPFAGLQKPERITIKPPENLESRNLEITVPNDQQEIDYSITWIRKDGSRLTREGKDKHGLVFIDNVPLN
jgi:hypothetical protein